MNMNLARLIPLGLCLYPHSISYDSTIIYQSKIKPYVQKDKIIPRSKNQTEIPKLPDNILEEDLQTHLINAREHYFDNTITKERRPLTEEQYNDTNYRITER